MSIFLENLAILSLLISIYDIKKNNEIDMEDKELQ